MFNGMVYFKRNYGRWLICDVIDADPIKFNLNVENNNRLLMVTGNFIEKPKIGTFCKRPHKLIEWSK